MITRRDNKSDLNGLNGSTITELKDALEMKGYVPVWEERLVDILESCSYVDGGHEEEQWLEVGLINGLYKAMFPDLETKSRIYLIADGGVEYAPYQVIALHLRVKDERDLVSLTGPVSVHLECWPLPAEIVKAAMEGEEFPIDSYNIMDSSLDELARLLWPALGEKFYGIFIRRDEQLEW